MKKLILPGLLFLNITLTSQIMEVVTPEDAGFSTERLERIDQYLNDLVAEKAIPGAVALIMRDGNMIYHKAFGFADVERKIPMEKNHIFRIASQSKAIASVATLMLWEEGKFLLDDPVSKYIPEFKNPQVLKTFNAADSTYTSEPAGKEITIRHLLTHTSGIDYAAIGSAEMKAIYAKAGIPSGIGNDQDVLGEKMRKLGTLPLKHAPGEKYTYGLNMDVLGYLVEIWSGMSFDEFLRKRMFDPMGMDDTWFYLPDSHKNRLVPLYADEKGKVVKMEKQAYDGVNPDYPNLAGKYFSGGAGLSSTTEDYGKFLQMVLNNGKLNENRIISRKTKELMLTNQIKIAGASPYGLAFGLETSENDWRTVLSEGSFFWGGAFNTHYWADPMEGLVGIIFTNIYQSSHWNIGDKFKILTYQALNDW